MTSTETHLDPVLAHDDQRSPGVLLHPGRWRASTTTRRAAGRKLVFGPAVDTAGTPAPTDRARSSMALRLAVGLAAIVIAYWPSVTATLDRTGRGDGRYAVVVIPLALALAIARFRQGRREPNIHDRQLDYLMGIPLLGAAWFVLVVMPHRVPDRYWELRVDVLSFPLFVAGVVAILFGVRALWRWRASVLILVLCWPPLYDLIPGPWVRGDTGLGPFAVERIVGTGRDTGQGLTGGAVLSVVLLVAITLALGVRARPRRALLWVAFIAATALLLDAARALVVGRIDLVASPGLLAQVRTLLPAAVLVICIAVVLATRRALGPTRLPAPWDRSRGRRGAGSLVPALAWVMALALACLWGPAPDPPTRPDSASEATRCCE